MNATKTTKLAYATRTDGNTYNVTYAHSAALDRDVSWSYIRGLLRRGYTVKVNQTNYRPEGEPAEKTYTPDMV